MGVAVCHTKRYAAIFFLVAQRVAKHHGNQKVLSFKGIPQLWLQVGKKRGQLVLLPWVLQGNAGIKLTDFFGAYISRGAGKLVLHCQHIGIACPLIASIYPVCKTVFQVKIIAWAQRVYCIGYGCPVYLVKIFIQRNGIPVGKRFYIITRNICNVSSGAGGYVSRVWNAPGKVSFRGGFAWNIYCPRGCAGTKNSSKKAYPVYWF